MDLLSDLVLLLHVFCVVVWLGFDLIVFALSLSLLKRELPAAVRLERAHLAEVIDKWVLVAFVVTVPTGVLLAYWGGWWPLVAVPWLALKLIIFGFVTLMGIKLLSGAAGTTATLRRLVAGEGEANQLEADLRRNVVGLAPYALFLHACLLAMIFIALTRVG